MPLWLTIILAAVIATALMFVWTQIAKPFLTGFYKGMKDDLPD
jgi:hypothetical protein